MTHYKTLILVLTAVFAQGLYAAPLYFQVGSNNATGSIDGVPFTGASWILEIEVDDTSSPVTATLGGPAGDQWLTATYTYTTTRLAIDGDIYTLDLSGIKTPTDYLTLVENRDLYIVRVGGSSIINTGSASRVFLPPMIPDVTDLSSVNTDTSIFDTSFARFNNQSSVTITSVPSSRGEIIVLSQAQTQGTGDFFIRASTTSIASPKQIPSLGAIPSAFLCLPFFFIVARLRRKVN